MSDTWREAWRAGIAPELTTYGLIALRQAILDDDPALVQGHTTVPPVMAAVEEWPCEAACPVGFCAWKSGAETVGAVNRYFASVTDICMKRLSLDAVCDFVRFVDETPRAEMLAGLLAEVELTLGARSIG